MSQACSHTDLMIHAYIELQVPYYLKCGTIEDSTIDETPTIRPDMGATCQQCQNYDVSYEDWRKAPEELRRLFRNVRKDMEEQEGYIEGYPLEAGKGSSSKMVDPPDTC